MLYRRPAMDEHQPPFDPLIEPEVCVSADFGLVLAWTVTDCCQGGLGFV